ncbi:hypothetical protein M8J76_011982 [Diaphorina citri]|nr:hypothetical protein M8J76_011982 [Diaphorina citri]
MFNRRVYDIRPTEPPPSPPDLEENVEEEFTTIRPTTYQGRFHYLEDQPMEVTDSLKGYSYRRNWCTNNIYRVQNSATPTASHHSFKSNRNQYAKILKWALLPIVLVILLISTVLLLNGADRSTDDLQSLEFTKQVVLETQENSLDREVIDDGEYYYSSSPAPYPSHADSPYSQHPVQSFNDLDDVLITGDDDPVSRQRPILDEDSITASHRPISAYEVVEQEAEEDGEGIHVSESMHRTSLLKNKLSTPYPLKIQFNGSKFGGPYTTPVIPTIRVGGLSAVNRGQGGILRKKPATNVEVQGISTSSDSKTSSSILPVSPTLPSLKDALGQHISSTTEIIPTYNGSESQQQCFSPHLKMCRGVTPYDITAQPNIPGITSLSSLEAALPYFEMIAESKCSPRAKQFLCSLLEPECQPNGQNILPPSVAEECSDFILENLDLSQIFNCDNYPDLDHPAECVNLAKGTECLLHEFRCDDGTCIPKRWMCDNVRDCPRATDEMNCALCTKSEFRCMADRKCVSMAKRCDGSPDCSDGSDEFNCKVSAHHVPNAQLDQEGSAASVSLEAHSPHMSPCPPSELRCIDGRCIGLHQICNGVHDCSDGSDETGCKLPFTV